MGVEDSTRSARPGLRRVLPDAPAYQRLAAAEAAFWNSSPTGSLEANEQLGVQPGPVELELNERSTGNRRVGREAAAGAMSCLRGGTP